MDVSVEEIYRLINNQLTGAEQMKGEHRRVIMQLKCKLNQYLRDDNRWTFPGTISGVPWKKDDFITLAVIALILCGYFIYTFRVVHYFWGDFGQWHAALWRSAQGQILWRDFTWPYPPLAIYIYGTVGKLFGPTLLTFRILSLVLCSFIIVLAFLLTREFIPKAILTPFMVATSLLAISQSAMGGEGLASGMYTPAAAIGLLFALIGLWGGVKILKGTDNLIWFLVVVLGVVGSFLAKQDFWLPALVLVIFIELEVSKTLPNLPQKIRAITGSLLLLLLIVLIPYLLIFRLVGLNNFLDGITGYRQTVLISRLVPSWPFLLDQISLGLFYPFALILLAFLFRVHSNKRLALLVGIATIGAWTLRVGLTGYVGWMAQRGYKVAGTSHPIPWLSTYDLFMSQFNKGRDVIEATIRVIITSVDNNLLPFSCLIILPAIFIAKRGFGKERSTRMSLFIGAWLVAAHLRRLFEHSEPIGWLIAPVVAYLTLQQSYVHPSINRDRLRILSVICTLILCLLGISLFIWVEVRPRVQLPYIRINTAQGDLIIPQNQAEEFNTVRRVLESYRKEGWNLFSASYEGINYLLDFQNPTRLTYGVQIAVPSTGLARELSKLPERTLIIADCALIDCNKTLRSVEALLKRRWRVVSTTSSRLSPAFCVFAPQD